MLGRLFSFVVAGLALIAGSAHAQGKAELLWYSQAAFKLTTPGGKVRGTPAQFKDAMGQTAIQVIDAEPGAKKEF
jgi:hypothetical protein